MSSSSSAASSLTSSPRALIATTALASITLTTASILGYQALRRTTRRETLREDVRRQTRAPGWGGEDIPEGLERGKEGVEAVGERDLEAKRLGDELEREGRGKGSTGRAGEKKRQYSEELIQEQLARNYAFLGEDAMEKVRKSHVVVVGCGGVGSWAALMLLRSGVSRITLIDFDLTTLSSLNRHACATLADVGTPKVIATKKYLEKVAPWATITPHISLWRSEPSGHALLSGADWVLDCIDNITTKSDLLAHCHKNSIPVFSSMGAGAKCDPTRVQIADISMTSEDPLARSIRRNLRMEGIFVGIPVVYSTEVPADVKLLPLPEEEFAKGAVKDLSAFDDFRVRILPVLGPLPAIFGLNMATYVLQAIAGKPILGPMENKNRKRIYQKLNGDLIEREGKMLGTTEGFRIPMDLLEISLLYEELHHNGRSIIPQPSPTPSSPSPSASTTPSYAPFRPISAHPLALRPSLVRWDYDLPLSVENCVLMETKDALHHMAQCGLRKRKEGEEPRKTPAEVWGKEVDKGAREVGREARRVVSWRERSG